MRRFFVAALVATMAASAPTPAAAVLEACKTTVRDSWYRLKCDQVCENVATCVADGKRVCNGTCIGGPNDGLACDSDAECPSVSNVCVGGPNDGQPCNHSNQCPDEVEYRCGGGPSNPNWQMLCEEDVDCQYEHFTCRAGPNEDQICTSDADCPDSRCRRDRTRIPAAIRSCSRTAAAASTPSAASARRATPCCARWASTTSRAADRTT